nr:MAG: rep 40 protein helicase [Chemarfal virus 64]
MVICSPPSAGKNYFLDMIFCILINIGYLGTANKTNNFAFQEAPNKRCLVWNEVNYEPAMTDMCKQLTGGDTCKVRVKNNPDTYVARTPLFCMVNQSIPFMYELAFQERCVVYKWKKADFLKNYNKYPYPLSFFSLLIKYDIDFYICVLRKSW